MDIPKPSFTEGQKVKLLNDNTGQEREVLSISFNSPTGWMYKVSSKEVDASTASLIEGSIFVSEDDLTLVEEKEEENETE